jgi:prolyl-tRNA synthetase
MARVKQDPAAEMAALHERRMGLAMRRDEAEAAMTAAMQVIEGSAERRRQVLLAEARGEDVGVTVEQVDRDRQVAEHTAADQRQRAEALRTVEAEIGEAREAVIDAHPEHYFAAAVASSEATAEAISVARDATQAAATAWMATRDAWSTVRMSRRRRGIEDIGPEVPVSDLGSAVHELSTQASRTWPGGSREAYERWASRPENAAQNR